MSVSTPLSVSVFFSESVCCTAVKRWDRNSSVLLFKAALLLKIERGEARAFPDWLCPLQLLLRLDPAGYK